MEDSAPLLPISNYGAMKLSSEAYLSTWVEKNNTNLYLFRFPNVVGMPSTHGVVFDFIHKLKKFRNSTSSWRWITTKALFTCNRSYRGNVFHI